MNRKPPRYIIDPPEVQARVKDSVYARATKQVAKWEGVIHPDQEFIGNVGMNLKYNKEDGGFVFQPDSAPTDWDKFPLMSSVISSALLLYRLLCLFGSPAAQHAQLKLPATIIANRRILWDNPAVKVEPASGDDGHYKCIWWFTLRHKKTGEYLELGEWKGAPGIWTKYHGADEMPKSFRQDTLLLLNELCSPDCPHPYDGLVAGSVA